MKWPETKLILITTLLLVNYPVYSQDTAEDFDAYLPNEENLAPEPLGNEPPPPLETVNGGNDSVFGRSSDQGIVKAQSKHKYVNLNPETAFGPEVVESFDFPKTTLMDLTKHMQKLTGINIIIDKEIKGNITISAPTPITVGDAWKAYLAALNMNDYTLVKAGAFYKIVQARDVRYTPTEIYTGGYTPDTENYIMRIIPLKHISSKEIARSFRPFMSRYGRIIEIDQTNTVIIHDTGTNISRLVGLIKFLDVPGHEESLHIVKVQHTSAQEIAKLLDSILKNNTNSRTRTTQKDQAQDISKIIAEPRTNSIIAMASAQGAEKLRELVKKLDVSTVNSGSGRVHVYYLNYTSAEFLATTLGDIISSQKSSSGNTSGTAPRITRPNSNNTNKSELFSDDVKITFDKENNALVVTASPTDWLTLQGVIAKLDIPRDQVFVEGMIMETAISNTNSFGINILGAYGTGAAQRIGFNGGGPSVLDLLSNNPTNLTGLFVGGNSGRTYDVSVNGTTVKVASVNALISAVAADGKTNVLATPQIMALDNEEAVFEVGETVPVSKSTVANNQTSISVENQKVALTLKIKPQINKVDRFIRLKIDQKVDDFSGRAVQSGAGGVGTTTRAASTVVVVRDQDTIAMGGLMRDKETQTENKVPLLGDIPVLGWLFKRQDSTREKVNMLFFLTPKIIAPYDKVAAPHLKDVLNRRMHHLQGFEKDDAQAVSTVKGLYDKAKKQEQGPLYNKEDALEYKRQNESYLREQNQAMQHSSAAELEVFDLTASDDESLEALMKDKNAKTKVTPPAISPTAPAQVQTVPQNTPNNEFQENEPLPQVE